MRDACGQVFADPMDVLDLGRMAVFADPAGTVFGIWQPRSFAGAEIVNESNALVWNELNTRDPEAAKEFYGAVFGWAFEERQFQTGTYTSIKNGEDTAGGMLDMRGRVPDEVPVHWEVYFAVDDADATVAKAGESGGGVPFGPVDMPEVGRIAVLSDPFGATFAVIKPDPAMGSGS